MRTNSRRVWTFFFFVCLFFFIFWLARNFTEQELQLYEDQFKKDVRFGKFETKENRFKSSVKKTSNLVLSVEGLKLLSSNSVQSKKKKKLKDSFKWLVWVINANLFL